ncbi:MAG: hypothetical protein HOP17_16065 [Acidobacteria bacterium]|nr:hypothetical protein [Acidobacteriota bacterium]
MKWDGTTAYTTTEQKFNGRDQVLKTIQTDNVSNPIKTQEVTMTYDGHGRMKTRHYPIEDANTYTDWIYNADDSVQQIIDPRLAITNFTYGDPRGLTTQISYSVPNGSTIPVTPTTNFTYDNLGNRTSMTTTGVNTTTYAHDQLSRMTSETVDFDALANNQTIGYTYNLGGGLKSITDPFNSTVDNTNDKTGRLTAVDGTAWAQNTTGDYASNIKYRAFGQVKQMDYDLPNDDSQIKLEYDSRLRVNHSEATQAGSTSSFLMKADYSYLADSRISAKNDTLNDSWDRTMKYDFAGRLKFNQFGTGIGSDGYTQKLVYEQTLAFDSFSNMTSRTTTHWDAPNSFTATYTNGRQNALTGETLTFDASGNIIVSQPDTNNPHNVQTTTLDASGRRTKFNGKTKGRQGGYLNYVSEDITEQVFDGDGRPVVEKTGHRSYHINNVPTTTLTADPRGYQIWSSVLGSVLTSVLPSGTKSLTNVYAGGAVIARQNRYTDSSTNYDSISWRTADPVTGTVGWYNYSSGGSASGTEETEPLGQSLHKTDPTDYTPPGNESFIGYAGDPQWQCEEKNASWLWGEFHKWPVSCQSRHMQEATVTVYDYSTDKKENPQAIAHGPIDSPLPAGYSPDRGMSYTSKSMMSFALTSSHSKDGGEGDGKCKRKDGTYIEPCESKADPAPLVIPNFQDASVSGVDPYVDGDHTKAQQLPQCLRDFLRPFFPTMQVGNFTTISPVDDAQFISGLPLYVSGKTTSAITLGLYDIHYDSGQVDLTGGQDKSSIGTIAEELAHTTQFIQIWDEQERKHGPTQSHKLAQSTWQGNYLAESGKIIVKNVAKTAISAATGVALPQQDSYRDNKYEKDAQAIRKTVQAAVDKLVKSPCYP